MFSSTDNLKELIGCLDDQKLANFCRVLAVTISDLDIYENKSSCKCLVLTIPILEHYKDHDGLLCFRLINCVRNFGMSFCKTRSIAVEANISLATT